MNDSPLDTRIFEERLRIKPTPWLDRQTWEDLQLCLRYALAMANERYSMETDAEAWFAVILATLQSLKFTLFDHTNKKIVYDPHRNALSDVYSGYLPPPRTQGPWFKEWQDKHNAAKASGGLYNIQLMNASSHLSIEIDCEEDEIPVAILFYVYCITDPVEPAKKLNLVFDHLGARFNPSAFAQLRKGVEDRSREKLLAALREEFA